MSGGPKDLQDLLDARAESNRILTDLAQQVVAMNEDVVKLTHEIGRRPSHAEIRRNRRVVIFFVCIFGLSLIALNDEHSELCGPGARQEPVVDLLIQDPTAVSIEALREAAKKAAPPACDILFPIHAHNVGRNEERAAGSALYLLLGGLGYYFTFRRPVKDEPVVNPEPVDPKG